MDNSNSNSNGTMSDDKGMVCNNDISNSGPTKGGPLLNRAGDQRPELYKVAARTLREYHGVPSMAPVNLEKTMMMLQLRPGRLVVQGLAPAKLLDGQQPRGSLSRMEDSRMEDSSMDSSSDDSDSTHSSDGSEADKNSDQNSASDSSSSGSSSDDDDDDDDDGGVQRRNHDGSGRLHRPIHKALVGAGIKLRPRETRPLLRALGVGPQHLVKLGLVNRRTLLGARLDSYGGPGRGAPRGRRPHSPPPHGSHGPQGPPPPLAPPHGPDGPRGRSKPPARGLHLPPDVARGPPRRPAHRAGHRSREGNLEGVHPFRHPPHAPPHHARPDRRHFPPPCDEGHPLNRPGPECMDIGEVEGEEMMLLGGGPLAPPAPPAPPRGGGRHGPRHPGRPMHGRPPPGFGKHSVEGPIRHPHRVRDDSSRRGGEEGPGMGRGPHQHGFSPRRHGGRDDHRRFHECRGHRHGAREHGHQGPAVRYPGHRMREPAGPPQVHRRRQREQRVQIEAHGAHPRCHRPPPPPPALMMPVY